MDLAAGLVALAVLLAIGALAAIAILAFGDRTGRKSSTPPTRARISASQHPAQRAPTRTVPKASIDALHSNPERSQAPARDDSQPLPPPPARAQPNIQLIPAVPVPSKETAPVPAVDHPPRASTREPDVSLAGHPAVLVAFVARVNSLHRYDKVEVRRFRKDAEGTWWSEPSTRKAAVRSLRAVEHANLEPRWQAFSAHVDDALESSPLSRSDAAITGPMRRIVRWAALALFTRNLRDELLFGALDYALLSFPWTESIGALHPADPAENPWAEFFVAPLASPIPAELAPRSTPGTPATKPSRTVPGLFHVRYWVGEDGRPAASENEEAWLRARLTGVTATDARMLVKANGLPSAQRIGLLQRKLDGDRAPHFTSYDNGIEREPIIAEWVRTNFAITPNSTLCMGTNRRHLATPDGIGDGVICEIKTSIDPLEKASRTYRDQLQWQLHVTASARVWLVVENRHSRQIEHTWVPRNEERIATLIVHADALLSDLDFRVAERRLAKRAVQAPQVTPTARVVRFEKSPISPLQPQLPTRRDAFRKEWSPGETYSVVLAYTQGHELAAIAQSHGTVPAEVVRELAGWLLVTEGELVNERLAKFGLIWEPSEREALANSYVTGARLALLSETMQRDQLALAFKLLEARLPVVPSDLLQMLKERADT